MTRIRSFSFAFALSLILAGCNDREESVEPAENADNQAMGELQGGTISDAMLPLEQVRSQPPSLVEAGEGEDAADDAEVESEGESAPD